MNSHSEIVAKMYDDMIVNEYNKMMTKMMAGTGGGRVRVGGVDSNLSCHAKNSRKQDF